LSNERNDRQVSSGRRRTEDVQRREARRQPACAQERAVELQDRPLAVRLGVTEEPVDVRPQRVVSVRLEQPEARIRQAVVEADDVTVLERELGAVVRSSVG
jgi:hypothetical protein